MKGQIIGSRRVIVKNPDGTTRIIQQAITTPAQKANSSGQTITQTSTGSSTSGQASQSTTNPTPQQSKVQIIRGPDGKVSVRGLNPGQQLIQMPDGKLHVLTTTTAPGSGAQGK